MRDRVKERSSEEEREKRVDRKALQLSGKIPALGAGGPGSIPGEALFFKKEKEGKRQGEREGERQKRKEKRGRDIESLPSSVGRACGF